MKHDDRTTIDREEADHAGKERVEEMIDSVFVASCLPTTAKCKKCELVHEISQLNQVNRHDLTDYWLCDPCEQFLWEK